MGGEWKWLQLHGRQPTSGGLQSPQDQIRHGPQDQPKFQGRGGALGLEQSAETLCGRHLARQRG